MSIELTFINQTTGDDNSQIIFFQPDLFGISLEPLTAWRVIDHCGSGQIHRIQFGISWQLDTMSTAASQAVDFTGGVFDVIMMSGGLHLVRSSDPGNPGWVRTNNRSIGDVTAELRQDGMLLYQRWLARSSSAHFRLSPLICIALGQGVSRGDRIDLNSLAHAEITLDGPGRADILIEGGGNLPVQFHLRNFVPA